MVQTYVDLHHGLHLVEVGVVGLIVVVSKMGSLTGTDTPRGCHLPSLRYAAPPVARLQACIAAASMYFASDRVCVQASSVQGRA